MLFRFHSEKRWRVKTRVAVNHHEHSTETFVCHKSVVSDIEHYPISAHFPEIRYSLRLTESIFTETQGSWDASEGTLGNWKQHISACCLAHCPQQLHSFPCFCHLHKKPIKKKKSQAWRKSGNVSKKRILKISKKVWGGLTWGSQGSQRRWDSKPGRGRRQTALSW